jgi:uncharacterized membrane protein YfcA
MDLTHIAVLAAAGFAAGVINAIAGGGSLVSFPALLWAGLPSVIANATNTVAVWPGTVSALWAYRKEIGAQRDAARVLALPALAGGLAGSVILLATSQRVFDAIVPWLILFACAMLALQTRVAAWVAARGGAPTGRVPVGMWVAQLVIAVYGGYFGAGQGILTLAALGVFMPFNLKAANALKVLTALLVNGIAALWFVLSGAVRVPEAALMAVASLAGGWVGASVARRLPSSVMRAAVITYGVGVALWMLGRG